MARGKKFCKLCNAYKAFEIQPEDREQGLEDLCNRCYGAVSAITFLVLTVIFCVILSVVAAVVNMLAA